MSNVDRQQQSNTHGHDPFRCGSVCKCTVLFPNVGVGEMIGGEMSGCLTARQGRRPPAGSGNPSSRWTVPALGTASTHSNDTGYLFAVQTRAKCPGRGAEMSARAARDSASQRPARTCPGRDRISPVRYRAKHNSRGSQLRVVAGRLREVSVRASGITGDQRAGRRGALSPATDLRDGAP